MNTIKTQLTSELERKIYAATNKMGVFGCYEVTIGWFGDERVDYITYDTKGVWRCYEIKVSKSDFYSKSKKTFVGHFNYYVLPKELYEEVKHDIPSHIGVYIGGTSVKKAKRQDLLVDAQVLKDSLIRSLSREVEKLLKSHDPNFVNRMNRMINNERKMMEQYRKQYQDLKGRIYAKYGMGWDRENMTSEADRASIATEQPSETAAV